MEQLTIVKLHEYDSDNTLDEIWVFDSIEKARDFSEMLRKKLGEAGVMDFFDVTYHWCYPLNSTTDTDYVDERIEELKD